MLEWLAKPPSGLYLTEELVEKIPDCYLLIRNLSDNYFERTKFYETVLIPAGHMASRRTSTGHRWYYSPEYIHALENEADVLRAMLKLLQ